MLISGLDPWMFCECGGPGWSSRRSMRRCRVRTHRLFRVFPWIRDARRRRRGHPLFATPIQGAGRVDNPEHYRTLYASDSATGAIAEAFGNHGIWSPQLLQGPPDLPGSVRALAALDAEKIEILDLDDARELVRRRLRPSAVVTRERSVTQNWALEVFREKRWAGVRWWSYYDPRWGSFGVWHSSSLRPVEITPLTPEHPALIEAANILSRPWKDRF